MELLFVMAHWHAMTKLCMHNELTLAIMRAATVSLGKKLCTFSKKTGSAFLTKERSREYNAQICCDARKAASNALTNQAAHGSEAADPQPTLNPQPTAHAGHLPKTFGWCPKVLNLNTFKFHSLGDYADTIEAYGTSDSFSTKLVSD
jgi:hypothetical protein